MSQQTVLTTYFAVTTPEEIARNDERRWATLRNDRTAQQAFNKVSAAMRAEKSAEKQRKNDAKRACEYQAGKPKRALIMTTLPLTALSLVRPCKI